MDFFFFSGLRKQCNNHHLTNIITGPGFACLTALWEQSMATGSYSANQAQFVDLLPRVGDKKTMGECLQR